MGCCELRQKFSIITIFMIIKEMFENVKTGSLLHEKSAPLLRENPFCRWNPSVLVVDDDFEVGRILHRMLSGEQYQVQISRSVADAFEAIELRLYDVYVVDYNLKDGTGLDVAKRIRSKGSEAPIILLSGCDAITVALRAKELRIFDLIEKPFSRATICNAVKKAIGSPKVASA
jgi:DNA-binding NtrC family response regulator